MGTTAQKSSYVRETVKQFEDKSIDLFGKDFIENATFRELVNEYKNLWTDWPNKVAGEGTSFTLENTRKGKMVIEPKGNTNQYSTTGKNLFNANAEYSSIFSAMGAVENINHNTFITVTSQIYNNNTAIMYIMDLELNSTYVLSGEIFNGNMGQVAIQFRENSSESWKNYSIVKTGVGSFIRSINITTFPQMRIILYGQYASSEQAETSVFKNIQLEQGSTPTLYEPYTDGIPSPNSDYPQDIKVVTGENNIIIKGKNRFDWQNADIFNGYWNSQTNKLIEDPLKAKAVYIICKPNTTYTISKQQGHTFRVATTNIIPANKVDVLQTQANHTGTSITITTDSNSNYIWVNYFNENNGDTGDYLDMMKTVQIEESSTASDFEPYIELIEKILNLVNIELNGIGEYKDIIFKNEPNNPNYNSDLIEKAWYMKNVISKINLGDYNWRPVNDDETSRTQGLFICQIFPPHIPFTEYWDRPPILCNKYRAKGPYPYFAPGRNPANNTISIYSQTTIYIQNSSFSGYTDAQVKEALLGTILYYPKLTPTYTQITDNALINQLEELNRIIIPGGTLIIETESNEENATLIVSAEALGKEDNE